jgi:hypothetical protein
VPTQSPVAAALPSLDGAPRSVRLKPTSSTPDIEYRRSMYFGTSLSRLPQPLSSNAGPGSAARSPLLSPPPPSTVAEAEIVPLADVSQTLPGATSDSSLSARSQLKRALATVVTAVRRSLVACAKSAYGFSAAACCSACTSSVPSVARRSLPELTWLETMTM